VGAHSTAAIVFGYNRQMIELEQIAHLRSSTPNGFRIEDVDGDGSLEVVAIEPDYDHGEVSLSYAAAPRKEVIYRWNGAEFQVVAERRNWDAAELARIQTAIEKSKDFRRELGLR
jgi:hypothetical protein